MILMMLQVWVPGVWAWVWSVASQVLPLGRRYGLVRLRICKSYVHHTREVPKMIHDSEDRIPYSQTKASPSQTKASLEERKSMSTARIGRMANGNSCSWIGCMHLGYIYIYGGFGCKASTSLHVWNHLQIAKMVSLCWWLVSHRFCKTGKDFSTSFYISIQCGTQHDPAIVWLDGLIAEPASLTSQVQQLREARRFGFTMCQSQSCNTEFAYILHVNLFILFSSLPSYRSNCGRD